MTLVPRLRLGLHVWGSAPALAAMGARLESDEAAPGLRRTVSCNWRQAARRNGRFFPSSSPWPAAGRAWSTHLAVVSQATVGPRLRLDHALPFLRALVAAAGTEPAAAVGLAWDPVPGRDRQAGLEVLVAHGLPPGAPASDAASRSGKHFIPEQALARWAGGPIANRIAGSGDAPAQLERCFLAGFIPGSDGLRDYLAAAGAAALASDLHGRLPAAGLMPVRRL